jgi:hypothetical protein
VIRYFVVAGPDRAWNLLPRTPSAPALGPVSRFCARLAPVATVIFCDKLKKAHEHLSSRGVLIGPIQDGDDMQFFELRDTEGHLIEICKEP